MILRLGCGLVGWLLVFSHALLLAVIPRADCSTELWSTSLLFAALAIVAALWLLPAGLSFRSHLRWASLPAAAMWLYGVSVAAPLLAPGSGAGVELCAALAGDGVGAQTAPAWQRAWAPVQLAAMAGCAGQALRYWKPADRPDATPLPPR